MSIFGEILSLLMGDRASSPAIKRRTLNKPPPSEGSSSYFPSPSPVSSNSPYSLASSSASSSETEDESPSPFSRGSPMIGASYPIPPLEREYAAPTEELDVARQLAKKPLPRSLHSSLQRAATSSSRVPAVEDDETRARKLAAAKKELLALAGHV